jgi:hypothetical protein
MQDVVKCMNEDIASYAEEFEFKPRELIKMFDKAEADAKAKIAKKKNTTIE